MFGHTYLLDMHTSHGVLTYLLGKLTSRNVWTYLFVRRAYFTQCFDILTCLACILHTVFGHSYLLDMHTSRCVLTYLLVGHAYFS